MCPCQATPLRPCGMWYSRCTHVTIVTRSLHLHFGGSIGERWTQQLDDGVVKRRPIYPNDDINKKYDTNPDATQQIKPPPKDVNLRNNVGREITSDTAQMVCGI